MKRLPYIKHIISIVLLTAFCFSLTGDCLCGDLFCRVEEDRSGTPAVSDVSHDSHAHSHTLEACDSHETHCCERCDSAPPESYTHHKRNYTLPDNVGKDQDPLTPVPHVGVAVSSIQAKGKSHFDDAQNVLHPILLSLRSVIMLA
jgi:hypothetical protein